MKGVAILLLCAVSLAQAERRELNIAEQPDKKVNCNPAEAPRICAAGNSDGVLVAHENCHQFYKCANGVPVTLNCWGNLLYNSYKRQCDWPENVKCGHCQTDIDDGGNGDTETCNCNPGEAPGICAAPGSSGILVAHEKCNKFYKCDHGAPVTFTCHAGLLYDPYTESCDWPHNVNCGDRPIEEEESEEENGGTCNCNPGEAPSICAKPGSNGILIAHEKCNQFYKCNHGTPFAMKCTSGLLYNPYTELCDWPHNVNCGDRPIPETDNGSDENETSEEDNGGTCNCNPGEAPGICAAPGSSGILIAHEKCNKFYKCDHGAPVTFTCHAGLLYDPYTESCDWPHNVNCGDRPIPETDNGGDENDTSEEENEGTCNCNPGEAPAICAAPGSSGILIAHEKCNQFYKCDHGTPVAMKCNSGLLYNPYTESCDWPHNVNCGDRPIPETDNGGDENDKSEEENGGTCNCNPSEAPAICAAPGSNGILIAHRKCNMFYKCAFGKPVTLKCNAGLLYNPYTERCDWPHNVNCKGRHVTEIDNNPRKVHGICSAPGSNGILIPHEECNKFYQCSYGEAVALTCQAGLLYNPYTKTCDWPHNVNCGHRPIPEPDNGGNESEEENEGTCNCNPGEAPAICAAPGSDGILIAHEKCNQFYKCSEGKPAALYCQAGLLYNPHTESCDWPYNVNCGDRRVEETSRKL